MSNETSKGAIPSSKDLVSSETTNIQNIQNVLLIWLDNNIDENDVDCRSTIKRFTDTNQCVDFITDIHDERVCLIISGELCQNVVPLIHDVPQLHTIFIFCRNKTKYEQWIKNWSKISGVFTKVSRICELLKRAPQQYEQNATPISIIATDGDITKKKLDQLDPSFMYTQILKETLLTIKFDEKHVKEFLDHCRERFAGRQPELNVINKLETEYHDRTPIWWYTYESFLYPMLNRTLRLMNVEMIISMGFFISDLHRHIDQLHHKQYRDHRSSTSFVVYRGQGMAKADFEQLSKTTGGLLSFNNFLSTSTDRELPLFYASSNEGNPDLVGILFIMTIDPSNSSISFASVGGTSQFQEEDEVLFSMHTVFRIGEITSMAANNRVFQVNLTLTSENDKDLRALTDRIREESLTGGEGWFRLGTVLLKMGQSEKAQQVYEILLGQTMKESENAPIYLHLGRAKDNRGESTEAITCYEKALEIYKKTLSPTNPNLAACYTNIGIAYRNMGDYPKALSSHEKALAIEQQSLPPNHPDLGASYNNIGGVCASMGDYPKALSSYEKAVAIQQQSLPPNHPDLGMSYNNIGTVYSSMGDHPKALSSHEKALTIQQRSLPPNHPHLGGSYNNIGNVYYDMGDYPKALSYHGKALAIRRQSLPPNHPDLSTSYNNIGMAYSSMGDYPKALSSYEKAVAIQQQSLPPNHPHLGMSYNNIGGVYDEMGYYPKALSSYEKALAIRQQSLPPNHPDLGASYNNIGVVYENMKNYSKARSFFERAIDIGQQSLPANHLHLQIYRENLERVKEKL